METIRGFFFAIFHYYILKCLLVLFFFLNVIFSCNFISNVTADYFWNILHLPSATVRHQLTFIFLFIKSVFLRSNSTPLPGHSDDSPLPLNAEEIIFGIFFDAYKVL